MGHPIAGDEKYGDKDFNRMLRKKGLKRLFLHCVAMKRKHKTDQGFQGITAPLDEDLALILGIN